MFFLNRLPKWARNIYGDYIWEEPQTFANPTIYLTFDDGPHEQSTNFTLDCLKEFGVKATFFCIGKNVVENPTVYERILAEGHQVGNHTHNHLNGWKVETEKYLENVVLAAKFIDSKLFRPPYGRIKKMEANKLKDLGYKIVMWSLISGDFDINMSPEKCLETVLFKVKPGDILVFHNSEKSWDRMSYVLPRLLTFFKKNKWHCELIS